MEITATTAAIAIGTAAPTTGVKATATMIDFLSD